MIKDGKAVASVAILTMIWGSSFFLTTMALEGFHPLAVAFSRVGLAGLVLVPVAIFSGVGLPVGREWIAALVLGGVGLTLPQSMLAYAQQVLHSGTVSIFIAAVPLFILLLARLFLGEAISARRWFGFAIGFGGLLVLAGPSALAGLAGDGPAVLMAMIAAVCYAISSVAIRGMNAMHPLRATAGAMVAGTIVSAPFGLSHIPEVMPSFNAVAGILALGLFPTGIAQILRYYTVRRSGPVFASIVGYLIPIWAGFLGVLVLDESLGLHEFSAYALILTGLLVARERARP